MAKITIELGTVTLPDNTIASGKLRHADMKAWLDEKFDAENAGGDYPARMRRALRLRGILGVTEGVAQLKVSKARVAATVYQTGLATESE